MTDLDAIKGRVRNAYLLDRNDGDALERAMGDVKALLAEVERLEGEAHTLRVWTEEAARAENLNAEDAKKERAAVVALLRESQRMYQMHRYPGVESLVRNLADIIERGEHRREEEP